MVKDLKESRPGLRKEILAISAALFFCASLFMAADLFSIWTNFKSVAPTLAQLIETNHPLLYFIVITGLLYLVFRSNPIERQKVKSLSQRLVAHTAHTPLATFVWDKNFNALEWNPTAERIFGFSKEEALGKPGTELIVPPEIRGSINEVFRSLLKDAGGFRKTNENVTKDGRRIICEWYNTPLKNEEGEVYAIASLAMDVTERVKAENENRLRVERAKKEQAAILRMASNEAIVDGRFEDASRLVTEVAARVLEVARSSIWLLSADDSELVCLDLFENGPKAHSYGMILRAKDYPRYFEALSSGRAVDANDAVNDPRTSEFTDGYLNKYNITSMLDAAIRVRGKVIGVLCCEHVGTLRAWSAEEISFAADVADQMAQAFLNQERVESQEALQRSEEMFRQLTENVRGVFWLSSPDKKTAYYISPAFQEVWGRPCEDYYRNPLQWLETVHPEDRERVLERLPHQAMGSYDIEFRILRPDGSYRWIRDRAFPIQDANGNVYRIAGIAEDITNQKLAEGRRAEMEKQFRQAQKMEALGALAGGIAHDFNNILSSIIGYMELIQESATKDEMSGHHVESVLSSAYRAKDLVKQILAFTRKSDSKFEVIQLSRIVEEVVKLLKVSLPSGITIETNILSECTTMGDASQLYQVLMNLCTNGIYSMRVSGGVLNITVDQVQENSGEDNAINTRFAKISVRDSGLGISTVDKDKIFDPFFTTKPVGDGTGLGLSVVHGVVRSHLGRVEVNSAEGAGAEFVVYLPITELVENKTAESATEIATGHERVFFVDDDEMVARLALEVLQRYGYEVSVFTDPLQAFQRLQSEETCDLLITDLTMPTMNGVEFAKRVREIRPDLKIILCTGYDPSFSRSEDENLISARISKPFSLSDLLNTLRNVLDTEVEYSEQRDMAIGT